MLTLNASDLFARMHYAKAKVFVEFYSLLFLPWDQKFDPMDPANPELRILPWNETTSWANFTKIFRSFDVDTQGSNDNRDWFRRKTYKFFTNMSQNLVQSSRARKILLAWRAKVADSRSDQNQKSLFPANNTSEGLTYLEEAGSQEETRL